MQVFARRKERSKMHKTHLHGASVFLIRADGAKKLFELRYLKPCFYIMVLHFFLVLKLKREKSYHGLSQQVQGQQQTICRVNFLLCVR